MTEAVAVDAAPAAPATAPIVGARHRYILLMLLAAYTLSFLDRQVISILAEPIKIDLKLSDTQLGLLTGLAFAMFYTFLGIPIARLADRHSRPLIIAASMAIWSGFTVLSARAMSFPTMAIARIGVGFGEAGCNPSAHSLIADITPPERRASALAFYSLGVPIGTILGLVLGGLVADAYGWRTAFLVAGLPGLILSIVILVTIKEPRTKVAPELRTQHAAANFGATLKELGGKRTFWLIAFACGVLAFVGYGHGAFGLSFFSRIHGTEMAALAKSVGLGPKGFFGIVAAITTGGGALVGTFLGGVLADRAAARDKRAYMSVPAIGALVSIPFIYFIYTVDSPLLALALGIFPAILNTLWYGPIYATAQSVVPPHSRATAAAILLFILNLIGLGGGPLAVGALSDLLAVQGGLGVAEGIRWSMIITGFLILISVALFWLARRTVREDIIS